MSAGQHIYFVIIIFLIMAIGNSIESKVSSIKYDISNIESKMDYIEDDVSFIKSGCKLY